MKLVNYRINDKMAEEINLKLLEHFHNPRNVGSIEKPDGFGRAENPINGFMTDIYLKVENGKIIDIKFKTMGCTVTIASGSAITEIVMGKAIDEILSVDNPTKNLMDSIDLKLGVIPIKNWHCLPTAVISLLNAIHDYYRKIGNEKKVEELEKLFADIKNYCENYKKTNLDE
jgi:nitrogen fixation NifU-like protein